MPLVIVLPRHEPGLSSLEDMGARTFEALPLEEALAREWPWDAHFALYTVEDEPRWPRVNKEALPLLRAAGASLRVSVTALDYDRHDLPELTDGLWRGLRDEILSAPVPRPTYLYRTSRGARIVYVHEPLEPEDSEALHGGLLDLYAKAGIPCDPAAGGWNRVHRLPRAKRDDGRPTPDPDLQQGPQLDHAKVPRARILRVSPDPETLRRPFPATPHTELIWFHRNGGYGLSEWAKEAKRRLAGRQEGQLAKLFDQSPPPVPDPRNSTIMGWAGCCAAVLIHLPGTTPEHLYALFEPAVSQSTRPTDPPHRNLHAETWKMVLYCWARENAKHASLEIEAQELGDQLTQAVKGWPTPPADPTLEWVLRHAVVSVDGKHYVLQADGYYNPIALNTQQLFAGLRDSGLCPALIDLEPEDKPLSPQAIVNRYSTALQSQPRLEVSPHRAWIDGTTLCLGAYHRRTDLEPLRDQRVDEWLRRLFGPQYQRACRWIGLALAVERGPTCAISLQGRAGSGKGMFVQGLAECFNTERYAWANVFGTYQYGIAETPILWVDEGWPDGIRNVADTFRRLVGGTTLEINRKNQPIFQMVVAPRVVLTANNNSVVSEIFKRKQLDYEDHRALAQRIFHVEVTSDAALWLERSGGRAFTHAWVRDQGVASRYTVARHFLWLYQQHGQSGGASRFLMEGSVDLDTAQNFAVQRDDVAEIGQAVVAVVAAGKAHEHEGRMWVRPKDVQDAHEVLFGRRLSVTRVNQGAQPFCVDTGLRDPKFKTPDGRWERGRAIDTARLTAFAQEHGLALAEKEMSPVGPPE